MKPETVAKKAFANTLNEELITKFINSSKISESHIITVMYQSDISWELREALRQTTSFDFSREEIEEAINKVCPKEVTVIVHNYSNCKITIQLIKTPKCRI